MQLPRLRAVAFVDEDEQLAGGAEARGRVAADVGDERVDVAFLRRAELLDERADQPVTAGLERVHQVRAAAGAADALADALEDLLDLFVQLGAVGDDQHAAVRHALADPLGQPDHRQALAAALRVPDDAALAPPDARLRRPHPEVLIVAASLADAGVEDGEVVRRLQQALARAELAELAQQRVVAGRRVGVGLLPPQPVLLRRPDRAVAQPLGVVARQQKLHGGVERTDELLPLRVEALADALGHGHRRALQLDDGEGDAVDVEHQVGPPLVLAGDGHFFGEGEVVGGGVLPVDQPDRDRLLSGGRPHLHPVAQQAVDRAVGVVEGPAAAERGGLAQLADGALGDPFAVALAFEEAGEQRFFDVGVARAGLPVAEPRVAERAVQEVGDAPLRAGLPLADRAHGASSPARHFSSMSSSFSTRG